MFGNVTGSQVFIKSNKFIKILCDLEMVIVSVMHCDIRSLIIIEL